MRKPILSTVCAFGLGGLPVAYINTNAQKKLFICATPQSADLDRTAFEALTWVEVKGVGSHGEVGSSTNILSYDTWDLSVVQKGKGLTDAGSPEIELARLPFDPGQILMRTACTTQFDYAFKIVGNDPSFVGGQPTIVYNRGIVTGPKRPLGRNEDFDVEVFMLGFNQTEVVVNPLLAGTAPFNTVLPAITGTATVGQTLTLSNGTWTGTPTFTYAWFAGGVQIPGAFASTFVLTAAQVGRIIQGRVVGTNAAGIAQAYSGATAAVA